MDERGGGEWAHERAVDERGSLPAAGPSAFFDLVVQGEPVAEPSDGGLEGGGDAVGVGAVGGQDAGGQAESGQLGKDVDRVGAGADGGGVELETQAQLRVRLGRGVVGVAVVGGDGQGLSWWAVTKMPVASMPTSPFQPPRCPRCWAMRTVARTRRLTRR